VPKADTSGKRTKGQFTREAFRYDAEHNVYRCPAGQSLPYSFSTKEQGKLLHVYMTNRCQGCDLKAKCTTGKERRIRRWEHEHRLEAAAAALKKQPDAMRLRKQIVEHPFGTIKHWMGATHFVMKRLENVQAEMSLYVLGYNLKRAIAVLGMPKLMAALEAA
ncbi:MAG: transposase, partial [Gammaproteobacteria bacterium]|nr:transposase [Gammaproteobacteria bacterium]